MGSESFEAYHENYSSSKFIHNIEVPTMFYYCEDDPIINANCINMEACAQNENIILASNKHGSHLCSYEHFFTVKQYFTKPALEFFSYFR